MLRFSRDRLDARTVGISVGAGCRNNTFSNCKIRGAELGAEFHASADGTKIDGLYLQDAKYGISVYGDDLTAPFRLDELYQLAKNLLATPPSSRVEFIEPTGIGRWAKENRISLFQVISRLEELNYD